MVRSVGLGGFAWFVIALVTTPVGTHAQTCEPGAKSHEADLFAIRSLSLVMGRAAADSRDAPGTVRVGGEAMWLPRIDDETARPTSCRPGKEPENVNALPVVGRARVSVTLPRRFTLEASWLPPVTLKGMQGNLVGIAVSKSRALTASTDVSLRVHAVFGRVTGPFTCPASVLDDATSECFQGTESEDRLNPNISGADVAIVRAQPQSAYAWYAGAGFSQLRPRFHVNFTNSAGEVDTTVVSVNMTRIPFFAGVTRKFGAHWHASLEAYGTSRDGATVRVAADRVLRRGK